MQKEFSDSFMAPVVTIVGRRRKKNHRESTWGQHFVRLAYLCKRQLFEYALKQAARHMHEWRAPRVYLNPALRAPFSRKREKSL
ncbi:MAG TPA: hypothetical protein VKV96_10780 [Roseiarcus sp.]|nr:hypothetical protein [Roseiarcus sp.]